MTIRSRVSLYFLDPPPSTLDPRPSTNDQLLVNYRPTLWLLIGTVALACRPGGTHLQRARASLSRLTNSDTAGPVFADSLPALDSATVVLFWTGAVDTLSQPVRDVAAADLKATAGWAADYLSSYHINLLATRARGVYVTPPVGERRFVDFRGLDFPFGFVLIEPGYPERFLTGIVSEDDLRDELVDYFDLEAGDSSSVLRTRGELAPPRASSRAASRAAGAKGFCRKTAPGGSSPCWTITSGV